MKPATRGIPLLILLLAPLAAAPSWAGTVRVAADSTINLPAGSSFTAPANWYVSDEKGMLLLQDPDQQLRCAFVEAADSTALAAIANAWQRVEPGFSRAIHRTVSPPARDGWDEIVQNVYETTSAEAKTIIGLARRKGATWHVNLLEGPDGAMEKRSAQMNTAIGTWKPKGLQEESFAGRTAHALDATRLAALERFIEDARTQTKVPGASIAIVQGGRVVYEKGFGVRRVGGKEPVTSKTLFMIGSMTKSLTTLMMAKLVDEGRFQWDTPVVKVYPRFSLADPDVTPKVTMAHTVCACTGLPRQDMEFLFEYAQATPEMRVASMGRMKTTTGFGETFQYSNTMVSTGGYVAAYSADPKGLLGPAYDRVMQSRVFDPLGMTATTFDPAVAKGREHATPHGRTLTLDFTPIQIENEAGVISVRPAGAAWSNVEDLSRYLTTELSGGLGPSGTRVVSTENLLKRREPQTRMSDKMTYGLGLMAQDDHGVKVFTHGGNNLGYTADMYFLPEQGVGGVLLTNGQGANFFAGVVRRRLMELLFDGREEAASMLAFGVKQQGEIARKTLEYVLPVPEKDWMAKWNGSYASPDLGTITVRTRGSESLLDAGEWKCAAGEKKEKDGSRTLILTGPPLTGLEFIPTEAGGTTTLTLKTPQQDYVFTKSGGKSAAASAR